MWKCILEFKKDGVNMSVDTIIAKISKWLLELNLFFKPKRDLMPFPKLTLDFLSIISQSCHIRKPYAIKWIAPTAGKLKLNIDSSYIKDGNKTGGGGILRDENANLIFSYSCELKDDSVLGAKSKGLLIGPKICYSSSLCNILIDIDSRKLATWFNFSLNIPIQIFNRWEDMNEIISLIGCGIKHMWREKSSAPDLPRELFLM